MCRGRHIHGVTHQPQKWAELAEATQSLLLLFEAPLQWGFWNSSILLLHQLYGALEFCRILKGRNVVSCLCGLTGKGNGAQADGSILFSKAAPYAGAQGYPLPSQLCPPLALLSIATTFTVTTGSAAHLGSADFPLVTGI